jgi:RNA polymerase sigma-70 factor (ECF subfamily)
LTLFENMESEKHIRKQIKKGNKQALEVLFRENYSELCNYAFRYLKSTEEAEEIVQETFFRLWNKKSGLNIKKSLKSYLYTSVRNLCIEHGRHLQIKQKYVNDQKTTEYPPTPQKILEANQLEILLKNALEKLPERCRKIFRMSRNDGMKYSEIAEKLSISVKTVEADMGQTLKVLRNTLKVSEQ